MLSHQLRSRGLVILASVVGFTLEVILLQKILGHPAGGWPKFSWLNLAANGTLTSLPYVALIGWAFFKKGDTWIVVKTALFMAVVGIGSVAIALDQYGHATPYFLLIGFLAQWITLGVGSIRGRPLAAARKERE